MNELEKTKKQLQMARANGDEEAVRYFKSKLASITTSSDTKVKTEDTPRLNESNKVRRQLEKAQAAGDTDAIKYFKQKMASMKPDKQVETSPSDVQQAEALLRKSAGIDTDAPPEVSLPTALDAGFSTITNLFGDTAESVLKAAQANPVGRATVKLLAGENAFGGLSPEEEKALPREISQVLRFDPFTQEGEALKKVIGNELTEVIKSTGLDQVGAKIAEYSNDLENLVVDETGVDPVTAQGFMAFPQVMLEVMPFAKATRVGDAGSKISKKFTANANDGAIANFLETPDLIQQTKEARNLMYADLKGKGARLKKGTMAKIIRGVEKQLELDGVDLKATGMQAKLNGQKARLSGKLKTSTEVTDRGRFRGANVPEQLRSPRFNERDVIEQAKAPKDTSFIDIENLRRALSENIDRTNGNQVFAANRASRYIDAMLDRELQNYVEIPPNGKAKDIRKTIRTARDLGGRVRRAEDLNELWYQASLMGGAKAQMGALRKGVRQILKDNRKFYTKDEINLMEQIARNDLADDVSTLRMIGAGVSKVAPPVARFLRSYYGGKFREMPTVSRAKYFAESLMENSERTGDAFVALQRRVLASKDANEAINKYLREVPKGQRDSGELGLILSGADFDLNKPIERVNKLKKEAIQLARGKAILDGVLRASVIENADEDDENE